jgi:hypothetical protein
MAPFHLHFTLSRRQRLALELPPWLPGIAATAGFVIGTTYAGLYASPLFFFLLLLPPVVYRGLFALAFDLVFRGGRAVELFVGDAELRVASDGKVKTLPLGGLFQVFRSGDAWTVLHLDGTVVTIPAGAIADEQVAYLRSFARRTAAALRAEQG